MYKRRPKTGTGLHKPKVPLFSSTSPLNSSASLSGSLLQDWNVPSKETETVSTKSGFDFTSPKAKSTPVTLKVSDLDETSSEDEIQPSPKKMKSNRSLSIASFSKTKKHKEKSNSTLKKNRENLTYMEEIVQSCGLTLTNDEAANILSKDQAVFVRDLHTALSSDANEFSRNVDNFIKDLVKYCLKEHNLRNVLLPTETSRDCDIARGATQDCFIRLLLHVDSLQTKVTDFLLDKLAEIVMNTDKPSSMETSVMTWVRMILQCLRFLDRDINGNTINDRLFDIILGASDPIVQQEVINCLPDIIGDAEHHDAALELSKLVRSTPQLLAAVLEALTNLSLQSEIRAEIQPVLIKALKKVQPEFLPNIIKFLFTGCDPVNMDEIITSLRSELVFNHSHKDIATVQVLVYSNIKDALLASKNLSDVWLKNINSVPSHLQHKPIDLIMLLLLHSAATDPTRVRAIETVFRNRIRTGKFLEGLIQETFQTHIAVVKEHFTPLMKIASVLLKSPEPTVAEFAATLYSELFLNVDGYWCKWIVTELQVYIGAGDSSNARSALNILQELTINHNKKIKPYASLLMMLLNKLSELQLNEVRQLMDLLCRIAYSSTGEEEEGFNDCAVLQDEINMLVQKQLASSQLYVLRNGVVGSVMAIKHMTCKDDNSESSESIEDPNVLSPRAKKAIPLLELVLTGTRNSSEVHGLALDEMSHMLATGTNFDQTFLHRMSTLMQDSLQDSFLLSTSQFKPKNEILDISLQFKIDDNYEDVLVLNIGELVVTEAQTTGQNVRKKGMSLICLHPLLRLIRRLEIKDLTEIDGLLGCGIAMPVPSVYEDFSTLTVLQQHFALHSLFHCINWLREIINCFAFLVKEKKGDKILIRLRTVVWLQGLLARCLPLTIDYVPPRCHFGSSPSKPVASVDKPTKKPQKPKGKKKKEKKRDSGDSVVLNDDATTQEPEVDEPEKNSTTTAVIDVQKYKQYFRELDIDVWLILTQPLTLSPIPEKDGVFSPELGPSELLFIMDDYVMKVNRSLSASVKRICFLKTTANQNIGFENLDYFSSFDIAKNTTKLLPNLCTYLEKTMEYTNNLLRANDGILDASGMFANESAEIKKVQGRILQVLATLFAWSGFNSEANHDLLLGALQKLASRLSTEYNKKAPKKILIRECVKYLQKCQSRVLDLLSAVSLVSLIKALVKHADNDKDLQAEIANVSYDFLSRQWYDLSGNREKGAIYNNNVDTLLTSYFHHSKNRLETIIKTLDLLVTEVQELNEKDATLNTFPVFSKINLHLLIAGLLKGLDSAVKAEIEDKSDDEQMQVWLKLTQAMESVVAVVKAQDSKPNLKSFVKGSTIVLRLFLSQAMPVCTFMFKNDPPLVTQVLKKLQVTTRYLQTVCNFIKVSRDTGLTQFLPPVRAVMETILLKVKNLVLLNNCCDAFFMGSMKNRDLKGELINSQVEDNEEQEEEAAEESGSDKDVADEEVESSADEDNSTESISQTC